MTWRSMRWSLSPTWKTTLKNQILRHEDDSAWSSCNLFQSALQMKSTGWLANSLTNYSKSIKLILRKNGLRKQLYLISSLPPLFPLIPIAREPIKLISPSICSAIILKIWSCQSFKMPKSIILASSRQHASSSSICSEISFLISMCQSSWIKWPISLRVIATSINPMLQHALRNYCWGKLPLPMLKVKLVFPFSLKQTFNLKFYKSYSKVYVNSWVLAKIFMQCVHFTEQSN